MTRTDPLYSALARTKAGFLDPQVKNQSEALLTALRPLRLPAHLDKVEWLSAVIGRALAACVITTKPENTIPDCGDVNDITDAILDRAGFWTREYVKLHLAAEAKKTR